MTGFPSYLVLIAAVLIAQLLLIVGLLRQRASLRRAEESLRHSEATLRESYDRIRQLTGRLIHAQEAARASIAQDLHDDICQRLAFVSMGLEDLAQASAGGQAPDTRQLVAGLDRDVQSIFDGLRRLSHELHPSALRLLGLAPALSAHCVEVARRCGVQVTFTAQGDSAGIDPQVGLCAYRIVQESLRNAVGHGTPKECTVSLARHGDRLELTVEDDGNGFDVDRAQRESGFGLATMHERVHALGGRFEITSEPGRGTRVHAELPLDVSRSESPSDPPASTSSPRTDGVSAAR